MKLVEALSLRINELLKSNNMTPYRLSVLSGVAQSTISDIRHMRSKSVNFEVVLHIAQAFNMELFEFLDNPLFLYENITE